MKDTAVFVLIPLAGYAGLWMLGSALFLVYFGIFNVPMNVGYNGMLQEIPPLLAILTVPLCSFASFFAATKIILRWSAVSLDASRALQLGAVSLLATAGLDLLTTVLVEGVDIWAFPVNLMYLFAYLVIVPSVVSAGYRRHR